jgi:hypothetical protein
MLTKYDKIMYILLFLATIIIFYIEGRDWKCANSHRIWEKCDNGLGIHFRDTVSKPDDSNLQILNNIEKASDAYRDSIKWRRSFVLGVSISFILSFLLLTPGTLPHWVKFYLMIILIWFPIYINFNNYSYHKFSIPEKNIKNSVRILKNKNFKMLNKDYIYS